MTKSDAEDLPSPGDVIAGKYTVVRVLGQGGMGIVLEAHHARLGQQVALKLLLPSIRSASDVTARFEREARAVARLQGPHVARILDVDALPDGSPFMVMELLRGRELGDELDARTKFPYREAVGYMLQACAAMSEAHRMGIVHRDLKPSNLFLCEAGGHKTVKVLDFGISKLSGDVNTSMTTTASAFGTPLYMSPEQVRSVKHVDLRTDIWSLGVVLYEMLSGALPFDHESATAILVAIITEKPIHIGKRCPEIPRPLADAVMKALEKNPSARFADVREFAAAIAPYGPPRDDPTQVAVAAELRGLETKGSSAGRSPLVLALSAVVAIGVVGGAVFALRSSSHPTSVVAVPEPTAAGSALASALSSTGPKTEPAVVEAEPSSEPQQRPGASSPSSSSTSRRKPSAEPKASSAPGSAHPPASTDPKYL